MLPAPLSDGFQSLPLDTHKQIGPFWCWFLGGWVCVHSRTLWVSPTDSPVRLGVSPTTSTLTGVFSQRFEAVFPCAWALGCGFVSLLSCSSQFMCMKMWDHRVCQPSPRCTSSSSGCRFPPLLPVWVSVSSLTPWLSDFHTVQFSVSSGCFCS